jgi:LPXTG-site transpeptidase (sortase) family protein
MQASRLIPGDSSCTIKVDVTAPGVGSYNNTVPIGALQTSTGNNTASASATLNSTSTTNANTTIATTLSSTRVPVGSAVHDGATLSGTGSTTAGGSVTYSVYTDSTCTRNAQTAGIKTVTNGVVLASNLITFNSAGTYYWQAVYSGATGFNPSTSACNEVLTVNKVTPTISTALSSSVVTAGDAAYDSASLGGATSTAIGSVTYSLYTDSACTLNPQTAGIKTVTNGVVQASNPVTFNSAGTYYWQAVYTGDNNNNGATSTCTSEVLKVSAATPVLTSTSTASSATAATLPKSGFAPRQVTILSAQSADQTYADLGDLWLEIPRLSIEIPIVGVPQQANGEWDVSWLGNQAGWLNGTAYPTLSGNSVLTAHVVDADGNPGPFMGLYGLSWGDKIIIHAWGAQYVYEVRQVTQVVPEATSTVLKHEDMPYVTLITCRGYDGASNSYKYRVMVRAVLTEVNK